VFSRRLAAVRPALLWGWGLFLVLGGIAAWVGVPHLRAWYHLREAREALDQNDLAAARDHLDQCLEVWPDSVEPHQLAAQAARRLDDLDAAEKHLQECTRLEKRLKEAGTIEEEPSEGLALEWALLRVQHGDLIGFEEPLRTRLEKKDPRAILILEALTKGYMRMYRLVDAMGCLRQWLEREPHSRQALFLRGQAHQRIYHYNEAIADYRAVLKQDRHNHDTRLRLATCLIESGRVEEAIRHLKALQRRQPDNPEVTVRLAFAQNSLGQTDEARRLLDGLLATHPDYGPALTGLGKLAVDSGRAQEAERCLRRAVQVDPADRQANFLLCRALEQQGKKAEAAERRANLKRIENRLERVIAISNGLMPYRPNDPALHCELGTIFLEMGQEEIGVRWLYSALQIDPENGPAHTALANYYVRKGDLKQAEEHRRLARGKSEQSRPQQKP
jgi:tetratricopeptide (TPR) repeat protein